jgi:hypothetical protein
MGTEWKKFIGWIFPTAIAGDHLDEDTYRKYRGGVGLGVKFLNIKLYNCFEGSWEKPTWLM